MRKVDVVVLTAITLEYQAAKEVADGAVEASWEEQKRPNGLPVAFRSFRRQKGRPLRVALTQAGDMGAVSATNALLPLVMDYGPRCIAMCGVCAGHSGKTSLGDAWWPCHRFPRLLRLSGLAGSMPRTCRFHASKTMIQRKRKERSTRTMSILVRSSSEEARTPMAKTSKAFMMTPCWWKNPLGTRWDLKISELSR
jgi:hypothetical protein